ncbi:MAG: helix-turn-helix transcriptional regulator [Bacteroidia bacterium]|jgi:DNA-binding HxlR family transcriptional regulator|nr:helix-turn-helix transcriptional regulator [Bacteroidia bacterium]
MLINDKEYLIKLNGETFHCALDVTMRFIGGKWKTVVLWYLRKGPMRFSELRKRIPQITEKMLSLQLRELEQDGIISRTVYAEVPPRVEYAFTEQGASLIQVVEALAHWGREKSRAEGEVIEAEKRKVKQK